MKLDQKNFVLYFANRPCKLKQSWINFLQVGEILDLYRKESLSSWYHTNQEQ